MRKLSLGLGLIAKSYCPLLLFFVSGFFSLGRLYEVSKLLFVLMLVLPFLFFKILDLFSIPNIAFAKIAGYYGGSVEWLMSANKN